MWMGGFLVKVGAHGFANGGRLHLSAEQTKRNIELARQDKNNKYKFNFPLVV